MASIEGSSSVTFFFSCLCETPERSIEVFCFFAVLLVALPRGRARVAVLEGLLSSPMGARRASVGKISAECCSFSAVSAPIFATKYAFCSIFQNLPDYQTEIFEI
jgi:hypothetical protein